MTTAAVPKDALRLQEAIASRPGALQQDGEHAGTVIIDVIRPTVGLGQGRHLYEAKMLEQYAGIFGEHVEEGEKVRGWKMYADHEDPKAIKARNGLPRPIAHTGGRIEESWWDPDVPAEGRFGQGAVRARVRPVGLVRRLLEEDPQILEASINAQATAVRPDLHDGQQVWVVEGIEGGGSVDWVSEGGAGGKVVELMEAMVREIGADDEHDPLSVLECLTDNELGDYIASKRSGLLEAAAGEESTTPEGGEMAEVTPEDIQEALRDPESGVREYVGELVEAGLSERGEVIRAEAKAEADRQVQLRDMRDEAHRMIEATDLPDSWKNKLRGEFSLVEGKPTAKLDQVDEVDDNGEVTKGAAAFLAEAVEATITEQRELLAEAAPTRIEGQGAGSSEEGAKSAESGTPYWKEFLQEAGVQDPDSVYGGAAKAEVEEEKSSESEAEAAAAAA
jgi:hypothetical protein